ncbi:MAG: hypothetical protein P8N02_10160 [Actinomycetota bacterium]|nr:hypothetical protein [Actinomycetota bacterium]
MNALLEFLERTRVLLVSGAIMLVLAVLAFAFANGGSGILSGVVLTLAGGQSLWKGVTRLRAERD